MPATRPGTKSAVVQDVSRANRPLRFITAASLFDGHDAAINIMRRLIQSHGAEVVHLGHNRSVEEVVRAALQEDADAIAVSSYQGGHAEYFRYMIDMLLQRGAGHVRVFGGGGGTITPGEIRELEAYGVERIYHPNDGNGSLPLIGVNTFLPREHAGDIVSDVNLVRSTDDEKSRQIANVDAFRRSPKQFTSTATHPTP